MPSALLAGAAVDQKFFLDIFEKVVTTGTNNTTHIAAYKLGFKLLKSRRVTAIIHFVRNEVGISMRTYANLVGCVKLSQPATPDGEIATFIDHKQLLEQLHKSPNPTVVRRGALNRLELKNTSKTRKPSAMSIGSAVGTPTHQALMQALLQAGITATRMLYV